MALVVSTLTPIASISRGTNSDKHWTRHGFRNIHTCLATTSSDSTESSSPSEKDKVPDWANPGSDVPPPWATGEKQTTSQGSQDLPYIVYLIASSLVAIAAVGSVFEYFNKNPIFGVIQPDSPFYTPVLGFFSITGLPVSAFLWFRAIKLANKDAERQDKEDGYL